jgi:post-segregation antitoxin (ccd killing protein)
VTLTSLLFREKFESTVDVTPIGSKGKPLEEYSKVELQNSCRKLGLKVSGTKAELIKRLQENGFGEVETTAAPETTPGSSTPSSKKSEADSGIRDLLNELINCWEGSAALMKLTKEKLKEKARELGLTVSGTKEELVQRILNAPAK